MGISQNETYRKNGEETVYIRICTGSSDGILSPRAFKSLRQRKTAGLFGVFMKMLPLQ